MTVLEPALRKLLAQLIPEDRIRDRLIDRLSFASDAGFYFLVPKAIVQPVNEEEVAALFHFSQKHQIPLVFRTAGTSLSGQSVTDGILVDLSRHWNKITIEKEGELVRIQPGITGAMVNAQLKKYRRKIGPDPASISAAMMGGILSNNSSGMCCGVVHNSYHTTRHLTFMLPDGHRFSTEKKEDYARFATNCQQLYAELGSLREKILSNAALVDRIRTKYRTKNVVGYSLNAFLDHEHPMDILARLLIGAEGTLAFITEAVMETIPDHPHKSTALLFFEDIYAACDAIVPLTKAGAMMVELMDRAALRSVEDKEGMPEAVRSLPENAAALLVEFQDAETDILHQRVRAFLEKVRSLKLINSPRFTTDHKEQQQLWKVRKGLFPAVGAVRKSGTTVILEDIAFPVEKLGDALADLRELFLKHQYPDAIIFGHAKDGNIHFVVTQSLNTTEEINRYDRFHRDLVELVVIRYDGALKAEHGTGRNMAPFVETEWGPEAYAIIQQIKALADPKGLLNPGVIINNDPQAHIRDLKRLPSVEEEVDKCIECGYCEHVCPSRDLTATPRRRIVARRVMKNLEEAGEYKALAELRRQYRFDGLETCAVDGLCATACPVDINTGDLVKRLRRESHSRTANNIAYWIADHFDLVEKIVRASLLTGNVLNRWFGKRYMPRLTGLIRRIIPSAPLWSDQLIIPPDLGILQHDDPSPVIIYYPTCISRTMGTYPGKDKNSMETFISICEKTNISVRVMPGSTGSCCSQIFSSKGHREAQVLMARQIVDLLWESTEQGRIPVVTDVSSCTYTLKNLRPVLDEQHQERFDALQIMDSVDFLHDWVMPRASKINRTQRIMLHPVCALSKLNTTEKFNTLAKGFARDVQVPIHGGCCGMAGDRGFIIPALTASATRMEAEEVGNQNFDGYYATTRTCEMALSTATGKEYASILYLVDEAIPHLNS